MRNILFIFLISLIAFSCVKKDTATKVSTSTGYTLSTANVIDSMHWSYDHYYRVRIFNGVGYDTLNTIQFKHGSPDYICEYLAFRDTLTDTLTTYYVTYDFVPSYSVYTPLTPYDYNNTYTNGNIWLKLPPNYSWHNYSDSFSFHDHFVNDSFISSIGTNTKYYAPTLFFKDSATIHTILPVHLIAADTIYEIRM